MVMDVKASRPLRFPPFRLDADNACLWRGAKAVRLAPKAFAVLRCLLERHGQLVTKDALLQSVWPETAVGDAVLKVCVREIRKALGDRVGAPRFVATVHQRGYRFIGDVTDSDPRPEREELPGRSPDDAAFTPGSRYRGPAHLVGREPVLDRFQRELEAAWRGIRQIVFVTGEPGIGKTGVVEAFLERVTADPRVWMAHRQCVETYGTREPYLPMLDALGRLCRESGADWLVTLLSRHAPTWLVQMPWLLDPADQDGAVWLRARARAEARSTTAQAGFFFARSATGKPASFQAVKPPSISHTGSNPICWATSVASADRQAPLQ
jgi:DNA-binding winged helix-turn-helix (wHTH) protein